MADPWKMVGLIFVGKFRRWYEQSRSGQRRSASSDPLCTWSLWDSRKEVPPGLFSRCWRVVLLYKTYVWPGTRLILKGPYSKHLLFVVDTSGEHDLDGHYKPKNMLLRASYAKWPRIPERSNADCCRDGMRYSIQQRETRQTSCLRYVYYQLESTLRAMLAYERLEDDWKSGK